MAQIVDNYLLSARRQFLFYKNLADKTITQLTKDELLYSIDPESNSIAIICKHIIGNMRSRWTDFLTSDGEKDWRNRDNEFVLDTHFIDQLQEEWESAWGVLFHSLDKINESNIHQIIYIRNMGHSIVEAIQRQLTHYAYHIGQIVYLGKHIKGLAWESLSIPKGKSEEYNQLKFGSGKRREHFTDDYLK